MPPRMRKRTSTDYGGDGNAEALGGLFRWLLGAASQEVFCRTRPAARSAMPWEFRSLPVPRALCEGDPSTEEVTSLIGRIAVDGRFGDMAG